MYATEPCPGWRDLLLVWVLIATPLVAVGADEVSGTDLYVPDPLGADAAQIDRNYDNKTLSKLSTTVPAGQRAQSLRVFAAPIEVAEAVDVISAINAGLLDVPTAQEIDFSKPVTGLGVPRQLAHLSMSIAGQEYVLWVTHARRDREGYRHVTAKILNVDDSYAQFTISKDRHVVATVVTPQRSYRILPTGDNTQVVYRLTGKSRSAKSSDIPAREFGGAQKRHLQALAVAELQPRSVTTRQNGDKLHIRGGDLGKFDRRASFSQNLRNLIERLGALSNATAQDEFVVTEQTPTLVRFTQVIGGVPVDARNQVELATDGTIVDVRLSVVDPARVPNGLPISKAHAMRLAAHAYARHYGNANAAVELNDNPGLRYRLTPEGQPLILEYRFGASAQGLEPAFVVVNALNEELEVSSALSEINVVPVDIWQATSGAPDEAEDPGTCLVHQDDPNTPYGLGIFGPCFNNNLRTKNIEVGVDGAIEAAGYGMNPPCCPELGDERPGFRKSLDIVIDTTVNPPDKPATYNGNTSAILISPWSGLPGDVDYAKNADSLAHEIFHHYQDRNGYFAVNDSDQFGQAVKEGMADAFAAAIDISIDNSGVTDYMQMGDSWTIGDGESGVAGGLRTIPNNLNLEHIQNRLIAGLQDRFHDAGRGVAAIFRRVWEKNVIVDSPQLVRKESRFIRFVMDAAKHLEDWDNNQLDFADLYDALVKAAEGQPALKIAVDQVWVEMGGTIQGEVGSGPPAPPGTPGGSGVAAAPAFVDGFFVGCNTQLGVTLHSVSWQGVPAAQSYLPALNWFGVYRTYNLIPAPQTSGTAYSNFNTDARIASCNSFGCSALSADNYVMNHSPACSGM